TLSADVILIATGSHPIHPPGIPFDDSGVDDSEGILKLGRLPRSLVVVGGGAVGCEYASIFTALGVDVTLVEAAAHILAFADGEMATMLAEIFASLGTKMRLSTALR